MDATQRLREPIVDGLFYPENPQRLKSDIERFISESTTVCDDASAIIAPHASYEYCGVTLGASYRAAAARSVKTVVIIAPVHREPRPEIFLTESDRFSTPLGAVPVDTDLNIELESCGTRIVRNDIPHLEEHAIEVQLPFVQHLFPEAMIVPILLGLTNETTVRTLSRALHAVFHDILDSILVVMSSNLCTNCDEAAATREIDQLSTLIGTGDADGTVEAFLKHDITACGAGCIAAALPLFPGGTFREHLRTGSPNTAGDAGGSRITYYGAFSIHTDIGE